ERPTTYRSSDSAAAPRVERPHHPNSRRPAPDAATQHPHRPPPISASHPAGLAQEPIRADVHPHCRLVPGRALSALPAIAEDRHFDHRVPLPPAREQELGIEHVTLRCEIEQR